MMKERVPDEIITQADQVVNIDSRSPAFLPSANFWRDGVSLLCSARDALLGGLLGHVWSSFWPGVPPGAFAVLGAAAVLAATTQGPISAVVLMMELTGRDRSFIVPLLLGVATATLGGSAVDL